MSGEAHSFDSAAAGTTVCVMSYSCCPAASIVLSALIPVRKAETAFITGLWEENAFLFQFWSIFFLKLFFNLAAL